MDIVDRLRLLVPSDSSGAAFDAVNEITRLTARVKELEGSIEDAHQAASETQPSWKHRCYAIMAALGVDYGNPDWMMPDEHKALTARVAELDAMLRTASDMNEVYEGRLQELEAALHRISLGSQNSGTTKEDLGREARAALTQPAIRTDSRYNNAERIFGDD